MTIAILTTFYIIMWSALMMTSLFEQRGGAQYLKLAAFLLAILTGQVGIVMHFDGVNMHHLFGLGCAWSFLSIPLLLAFAYQCMFRGKRNFMLACLVGMFASIGVCSISLVQYGAT